MCFCCRVSGGGALGQNASASNSQCTIYGANSSTTVAGNDLVLNVAATYATGFAGTKNAWGYAADNGGKRSQWVNLGAFTAQ